MGYEISSGNIFADLGYSNPEEHLAKVRLASEINAIIKKKKLSQERAAELLGIDQPKISALHRGRLRGFSLERLFRFLDILGQKITINITPKKKSDTTSHIRVRTPRVGPASNNNIEGPRPAMIAKKKNK